MDWVIKLWDCEYLTFLDDHSFKGSIEFMTSEDVSKALRYTQAAAEMIEENLNDRNIDCTALLLPKNN